MHSSSSHPPPPPPPLHQQSASSSLSDLYSVARRISFELQEGLIRLERLEGKGHGGNATLQEAREQRNKLQEMTRISQQMESQFRVLIAKENPSKRDTWKRKVSQISEECDQYRIALDRFGSRSDGGGRVPSVRVRQGPKRARPRGVPPGPSVRVGGSAERRRRRGGDRDQDRDLEYERDRRG